MALLKSLIQRLLDSRTTPAQAVQADRINISTETTFSTDEFVPPRDGFVRVWAKVQQGIAGTALGLNIRTNGGEQGISRFAFTGPSADNSIVQTWPVRKGETIRIESFNLNIQARTFFDAIGGGYQALKNALLQGGAICLKHLYSSLRRSSCRVRKNGSEVKVFSQNQIKEQRSLLTTLRLSFIRLQVMDGLHLAETDQRSMSALLESWERVALTLKVISELQLRFGRGIPLISIARRTISNRLKQNSFPAKGQRSTSLVGGASC